MSLIWIDAEWPAPSHIKAGTSTRHGGVSQNNYHSLNLALHVGDDAQHVEENRQLLQKKLHLHHKPMWLNQVHGTNAVYLSSQTRKAEIPTADASYTFALEQACVVLTADCLPVLICDKKGTFVAAAHAGWRGLAAGVLESLIKSLPTHSHELLVWLGPAISQRHYEVGPEMQDVFVKQDPAAEALFKKHRDDRLLADLYGLARLKLQAAGVKSIYGGNFCTYNDSERFFSYRRDGETGRMASLIVME